MAPVVDSKNALTDRERELMALAWLCFSEKPKPDYKKLAALAGMSNPVSASNAWSKIQKKITAQAGDAGSTPEVQTPKATPGKKRAAAAKAVDGDGDGECESPTKKTKTPSKTKKVKDEPVDEDGLLSRSNSEGEDGVEKSFF